MLFFAYDHRNCTRCTTVYLLSLLNLPNSYPGAEGLLRQIGFSVSRSEVPSSRNAVDITIDQTINQHAKSYGGIVGFSRSQSASYRSCMTRHARASYFKTTLEPADMIGQHWFHFAQGLAAIIYCPKWRIYTQSCWSDIKLHQSVSGWLQWWAVGLLLVLRGPCTQWCGREPPAGRQEWDRSLWHICQGKVSQLH